MKLSIVTQVPEDIPVDHISTTPKKRKWEDLASALNEKHEMEKHALILASMCTLPGIEEVPEGVTNSEGGNSGVDLSVNASPDIISAQSSPSDRSVIAADDGSDEEQSSTSSEPSDDSEKPSKKHKGDTKKRIRTTPDQLRLLEKTYEREKIPSQGLREELAVKLGMTPRRVQVWFQNKRAKERRMKKSLKQSQPENYHPEYHHFVPAMGISKLSVFPVPVHTYPRPETIQVPYATPYHPVYDMNSLYGKTVYTARYPQESSSVQSRTSTDWKRLPPLRYICNEM